MICRGLASPLSLAEGSGGPQFEEVSVSGVRTHSSAETWTVRTEGIFCEEEFEQTPWTSARVPTLEAPGRIPARDNVPCSRRGKV